MTLEGLAGAAATHRFTGETAEVPGIGGSDGQLIAQHLGDLAALDSLVLRDRPRLSCGAHRKPRVRKTWLTSIIVLLGLRQCPNPPFNV